MYQIMAGIVSHHIVYIKTSNIYEKYHNRRFLETKFSDFGSRLKIYRNLIQTCLWGWLPLNYNRKQFSTVLEFKGRDSKEQSYPQSSNQGLEKPGSGSNLLTLHCQDQNNWPRIFLQAAGDRPHRKYCFNFSRIFG